MKLLSLHVGSKQAGVMSIEDVRGSGFAGPYAIAQKVFIVYLTVNQVEQLIDMLNPYLRQNDYVTDVIQSHATK